MVWQTTCPVGTQSVRANKQVFQDNVNYIQTYMGNEVVGTNGNATRDHFWNVDANLDGHHRFVKSPAFTVGGIPADPVIGTGMDGVIYLKTTNGRVEGFYRNSNGIYQFIPSYLTGTTTISSGSSFVNITTIPDETYGELFFYNSNSPNNKYAAQIGFYKATGGLCQTWALNYQVEGTGSAVNALKFGNGSDASGLNIRARRADAGSTLIDWNYKIIYRAI